MRTISVIKKIWRVCHGFYWNIRYKVEHFINYLRLKRNRVSFSEVPYINGKIYFRNKGKIEIGKGVVINSCLESNPIGFDSRTLLVCEQNAEIIIRDGVHMSNCSIYAHKGITIEDDVFIGGGVKIYDSDFHPLDVNSRIEDPNSNVNNKAVCIEKGAFIGAGSIILKGVRIGQRAVIGAGSVVTKDVPSDWISAGNPAKNIRPLKTGIETNNLSD